MMIAPLGMIAADRIQSMIHGALGSIFSSPARGAESFDQVLRRQGEIRSQHEKAVGLVGAEVEVENFNGAMMTGMVESVELNDRGAILQINGQKFEFSQLRKVLNMKDSGEKV